MKSIRISAALLFFAALFAAPVMAQTTPASGGAKIAIISSRMFDDPKAGITKYVQAFKTLETEFKPRQDELRALETRLKTVSEDYNKLKNLSAVDPKSLEAKREEGEKLQLEFNYKQEQYKAALERRYSVVINPLQNDIGKALGDYSKQKGFDIVFDASKDEKGMLIWLNMQTVDVTADFIKFYNALPAATTTAVPK